MSTVVLYAAAHCQLCDRARAELEPLGVELGFDLVEIDIAGDPALERSYRRWIPVVEVAGERVSVYRVDERALRELLARAAEDERHKPPRES